MFSDKELADVALKAADVVRKNGWTRQQLIDHETGGVCSVGALVYALVGRVSYPAESRLMSAIQRIRDAAALTSDDYLDGAAPTFSYWNDYIAGSADDVIIMFEQAAANLKGDE